LHRRKEEEKRAKANSQGCTFTPLRPIPEGKAVIYLYKAWYGRDVYPIAVNGSVVTHLHRGGYFPVVAAPGKVELFMASRDTGSGTFLSTPAIVLQVEAGKEYYLELTTTFSAKLNQRSEEKGLKNLRGDRLMLPYKRYEVEFANIEEVKADPVYARIPERDPHYNPRRLDQSTKDPVEFRGGSIRVTYESGGGRYRIKLVLEQYGYAMNCSDQGIVLNADKH
jgi:hypothetical protein